MKKTLIILLIFLTCKLFAQDISPINRFEFLKLQSFPIPTLADYYVNMMNMQMNSAKHEKYGFLDKNGKIFKKAEFDYASDFTGKHANIIKDGIHGVLFKNGTVKYFPEYELTYWTNEKLGLVIKNKKYGFINTKGKIIVPLIYDDAFPFYDGYASVKEGNTWIYINNKGKKLNLSNTFITSYKPVINSMVSLNDTIKSKSNQSALKLITTGLFEILNNVKENEYPENLFDIKKNNIYIYIQIMMIFPVTSLMIV